MRRSQLIEMISMIEVALCHALEEPEDTVAYVEAALDFSAELRVYITAAYREDATD